jgi:hypothetical protein
MKLVIDLKDNEHPLDRSAMEAIISQIRAQELSPNVTIATQERRLGFGELASTSHLWQLVMDLGGPSATVAAASALIYKILPPLFKLLEARDQQKVEIAVGGVKLKAPARLSHDKLADLVDRLTKSASASRAAKKPPQAPKSTAPRAPKKRPANKNRHDHG